jgi:hypothetical protein
MSVYRGELINIEQKRREKKKLVKKVSTLFVFSFTGSGPSFVLVISCFIRGATTLSIMAFCKVTQSTNLTELFDGF